MNPDDFKLDPATHEKVYADIERRVFDGTSSVEHPRVVITGGQPGSGKSRLLDESTKDFPDGNVVVINGDELRRYHKKFEEICRTDDKRMAEFTDPDSRVWTKRLFDRAIETRRNIIFESTLRDPGPISETMIRLRKVGYHLTVKVVATPRWSSIAGIFGRYEDQKAANGYGRWSNLSSHDAGFEGLPRAVAHIEKERLVDKIEVYDRPLRLLYSNVLKDGEWETEPLAVEAIDKERDRMPNPKEKQDLRVRWDRILNLMEARLAPKKEIQQAKECKSQFF